MKPITTTKILTILAIVKNNDDICSRSFAKFSQPMMMG